MLNPESVEYNAGRVKLVFTTEDGDEAIKIYLTEKDAWELHKMIQNTCNMKAQEKRTVSDAIRDPRF